MSHRGRLTRILVLCTLLVALAAASVPAYATPASQPGPAPSRDSGTVFYVPKPNHGAIEQIADLTSSQNKADADLIKTMIETPQAMWFTKGTPKTVMQDVRSTVARAADKGTVPVLVAYNIPFRDCAQYSAGGATSAAEYEAWIDAFAAGIGNARAVVLLEPDGLGIIPWYKQFSGLAAQAADYEWCRPAEADPATAAADRLAMLNYAVDALKAHANVSVYLDGTHSAWLGSGDAAHRLVQAGVAHADGFFLNVSNYQFTANLQQYGTWVSQCIAYATAINPGDFASCPNQYWNGGPDGTKIAQLLGPWTGVALSAYGEWSDESNAPNLNTSGLNSRYTSMLGATQPTTHFVIDTSRNGVGPWQPAAYPDPQDWCNPPNRGLGLRPSASTGISLLTAYLWVKIPGESDGECTRGLGPAGTTVDPVWGMVDPAAGQWFPEMALQLAENAQPPLP